MTGTGAIGRLRDILAQPANALLAIALALAVAILLWPVPAGTNPVVFRAAAVIVAAIGLWGTHALPEHVTSLVVMLASVLLSVAPPDVAFSGFVTGGAWLLFSGIILGVAIAESGLAVRFADMVLSRVRLTYARAVTALVMVGIVLAFLMPATIPRIVVMMPIALALAERMGFGPGSRGRTGMALAVGAGTFFPTFAILPANLPNIVLVGSAEAVYGISPTYAEYLFWQFPISGALRAAAIVAVLLFFFRENPQPVTLTAQHGPLDARQRRLLAVLGVTLALWATDFLHGIRPAWIGLAAATVVMIPASGLLSAKAFRERVNLGPFLYVGGILGVGAVMAHSGLDKVVAGFLIEHLAPHPGTAGRNFGIVISVSMVLSMIMTAPGAPVLLAPLAQELSTATGFSLMAVLMIQLFGLSTLLLPYQGPPIVVALGLAQVRVADAIRLCLALAAITLIVLAPLNFLWWRIIGLLG